MVMEQFDSEIKPSALILMKSLINQFIEMPARIAGDRRSLAGKLCLLTAMKTVASHTEASLLTEIRKTIVKLLTDRLPKESQEIVKEIVGVITTLLYLETRNVSCDDPQL